MKVSIIIPAKNESQALPKLLDQLHAEWPNAEVIIVDDGSDDETQGICVEKGVKVIRHPYSKGNGAAIKSGARVAEGDILVFMDADGQHRPKDVSLLLDKIFEGYDMAIGARSREAQASFGRAWANGFYNRLATSMVGHDVMDLTSGFRAVKRELFLKYLYMLPNGFSYPTTITMAFFRAGYSVAYIPVSVERRVGKSHIKLFRDGTKFLLIIFKIGSLYSPLKIFFPVSVAAFSMGIFHYIYVYATRSQFSNMSELLFLSSLVIFLLGLVSEQVTILLYREK